MKLLSDWVIHEVFPWGIVLLVEGRHKLVLSALEDQLFRVSLLKDQQWRLNRSWTIAPDNNLPWQGRDRSSEEGFIRPKVIITQGEPLTVETSTVRLSVYHPLRLVWEARVNQSWVKFAEDRATGAMMIGRKDHAVQHFMAKSPYERSYGLGEKAGALERDGRRYEMRNLDALGYDARTTDPLYKHIPFLMVQTPDSGCWSIFYDNLSNCWFDLDQERDNYHAPYRAFRAEDGDLDYYLRWEPSLISLTREQVRLTGGTCFPPRWSLGYLASTMAYTDADDAQHQLLNFLQDIGRHDIPCDGFHLSSGYTSMKGKRYVFHWNENKFPNPTELSRQFLAEEIHLIANIKPCLLHDHPRYNEAQSQGLFVLDSETAQPERSAFWGDWGSHLDFSNPETIRWWKRGVTEQLLELGIESTWNDNNEYEIWDRQARCRGFEEQHQTSESSARPIEISLVRPLQSQWMCRSSDEAQRAYAPDKRPYLITRSGAPGIQRYAQTWTGDNHTCWKTLKWNIRMGLGLSLSGFFNIGHDIGGFSGPKPDSELFLRWVQNGVFHPRFVIHSWNDDDSANEPWMHPEITPLVRDAIRLRYSLLPYLYTCLFHAAHHHEPMLRPTFLDHPDDDRCYEDCDDFMIGPDLLVGSVVEQGVTERKVYLPKNEHGWWDFSGEHWYPGGQTIICAVTLNSIPLFVRAGAVVPFAHGASRAASQSEVMREWRIYPFKTDGETTSWCFDDDGENQSSPFSLLKLTLKNRQGSHILDLKEHGSGAMHLDSARLNLMGGVSTLIINNQAYQSGEDISLNLNAPPLS